MTDDYIFVYFAGCVSGVLLVAFFEWMGDKWHR